MKFGLLLPHFGEHASKEKRLEGSKLAEDRGSDSVWVGTTWSSSRTARWRSPTIHSTT